jgi:hypothetical protein
MALDTYSGLQTEVASYLGRSDLTDKIKTFVALAEKRFNRELRLRIMETKNDALVTVAGTSYVALPSDFREMRQVSVSGNLPTMLSYITPDQLTVRLADTGKPDSYTVIGEKLYFAPVPDAVYTLSLTYYAAVAALSDAAPTNALLTNHPDIYLYGALVESGPYTRTTAPVETWANYLKEAMANATQADQKSRYTGQINMRPIRKV